MTLTLNILILILTVAISGVLVKASRLIKLPLPIIQILLGVLLASPIFGVDLDLDPEVFLLLLIPPILFLDGWKFPKQEFYILHRPIFALAFGLVFFTILGVGYFINWLIPTMSLAGAFALAAVLSPTDAVAVSAITGQGKIPSRLKHVLEGEALMNDASGLVAFKFAIIAAMTGTFSLIEAGSSFLIVAIGGFTVGAGISWLASLIHQRLAKISAEEPGIQVIVLLLIPFTAYLCAEHFGVSGIMAAVGAGMTMTFTQTHSKTSTAARLLGNSVWSMLEFVFNGIAFILLGLQLPSIWGQLSIDKIQAGKVSAHELIFYIFAITAVLLIIRFVWVSIANYVRDRNDPLSTRTSRVIVIAVATFAGVRGSITLAAVMATPLFLPSGDPFPQRNLMIFLASGVIILTLFLATLILPPLVNRFIENQETPLAKERKLAHKKLAQTAIHSIREQSDKMLQHITDEEEQEVLLATRNLLIDLYEREISAQDDVHEEVNTAAKSHQFENQLRTHAIHAERKELHRLHSQHLITEPTLRFLLRDVDLRETWSEARKRQH